VTSPTPLPGLSRQPDNSHRATYSRNYTRPQYQCFQCGNPTHFKWDCPSTFVEHVIRLLQDMHLGHVKGVYMMMEFMDITTLMDIKMEILPENVNLRLLFAFIYFS
jgi:hypothetical protein